MKVRCRSFKAVNSALSNEQLDLAASWQPESDTVIFGVHRQSIINMKDGVTAFNVFAVKNKRSSVVFLDLTINLNKENTTDPESHVQRIDVYLAPTVSGGTGYGTETGRF